MTGENATSGKLMFPPRFLPYLEKHRIFELFHELTELLVKEKPKDHVKFLRAMLTCAANRRDKPRIVFLAPSIFDREKFAEEMGKIVGVKAISRNYLEMMEREKRLMEKLRRMATLKSPSPEEEMSCICTGEYLGEYEVHQMQEGPETRSLLGEGSYVLPEAEESIEEEVETEIIKDNDGQESLDLDPCKGFRVCPCKENLLRMGDVEEGREGEIKEAARGKDEEEERDEDIKEAARGENEEKNAETDGSKADRIWSNEEEGTVEQILYTQETSESTSYVWESSEQTVVDYSMLGNCEYTQDGWILVDFPENAIEAERLCAMGVLPTHAFRIITGTEDESNRKYKYLSRDWAAVYNSVPVKDIFVGGRTVAQLAESVAKLARVMPHRHAPMLPRIVLIGSRGSGATTQAKNLSTKYGLVHVEFQDEMAKVVLRSDNLSQMYKRQLETRPDPELEAAILEKILVSPKCQKRGWVLTGYPTTIDQMRMLDIMAMPPNRVIFMEVPAKECFIRLYYRKTDWTDAKEYKIPAIEPFGLELRNPAGIDPNVARRLLPHPRDDKRQIIHDIEEFFAEKEDMAKYCGRTAAFVDGNDTVETVFNRIDQILINPSPAEPPRDPLAIKHGIEEAYERLKLIRTKGGITPKNLMINPPRPAIQI